MGEVARNHPGKEPFPAGNALHLLHGLYSDRVRQPLEETFATALREAMRSGLGSVYDPALDEHAVRRAARALATVEIVETQIDREGVDELSDRVVQDYQRAVTSAEKWLAALGMTPTARAKLGVDAARTQDIVEAIEQRRARADRTCSRCGGIARYHSRRTGERLCEPCAGDAA